MSPSQLQPTLQSELILLRPLHTEDFDALFSAASDPLIWVQHPSPDRYKKEIFEQFFAEAMASKGAFAIFDVKTNEMIGSSRFYEVDHTKKEVVIGYSFLTRKYWGGIYNKDLKTLMMKHAFQYFDVIVFHVGEFNIRSQKAMEKIGGIKTGQFSKATPDGGQRLNFIYHIRKEDWSGNSE